MVPDKTRKSRAIFTIPLILLCVGVGKPFDFAESSLLQPEQTASAHPVTKSRVTSIVFVSRNPLHNNDAGAVPGLGPRYRTAIVGGMLLVRRTNGTIDTLVGGDKLIDVADPDVSWDGKSVLFSGVEHPDSSWRIYEIGATGRGFRKLTATDRAVDLSQFGASVSLFEKYDDFDPCYLPDGRIVFASTRYPSVAMTADVLTSNLFVVHRDGTKMRRITTERNGAEEPTIDPVTGKIVYSRWWVNPDRPSNITRTGLSREDGQSLTDDIANIWHAVTVKPDGDELKLYAGFTRTRQGTQVYKPSVMSDGRLVGVFTPWMSMTPRISGSGVRWFTKGASFEHYIAGVRAVEDVLNKEDVAPPYATDPVELNDRTILFSYSKQGIDYGIYSVRVDGTRLTKALDLPGSLELEPQVLAPRRVPPIIKDDFEYVPSHLPPTEDPQTYFNDDVFRFDCMNIFTNAAVDEPMPDAPRIVQNARIRFFMNVQRQNPKGPDPSIFLKDAPVFHHGGVHEHDLPAEVPLFEQVVDGEGKVLRTTDGRFGHVSGFNFERQGAGTKCVGCHIGHSMMEVPINGSLAEWFNVSPSATVLASSHAEWEGKSYSPRRIVDRQAQTGGDTVLWIADEGIGAAVELRWDIPVQVREFVLYGIPADILPGTNQVVQDCEILLYYESKQVGQVVSTGRISPKGSRIQVLPTNIDAARITIKKATGAINRHPVTGLAEVETIARLVPENPEFNRGK
ncbi:MAG: TolB family protein [Bacteroidota bacterium]